MSIESAAPADAPDAPDAPHSLAGTSTQTAVGGLAGLSPSYFALVMATGIVSIACHIKGWDPVAVGLFYINVPAYAVLWVLTLLRMLRHRAAFFADFQDHARSVGFFTMIAGSCVLGSQCLILYELLAAAVALWCVGLLLWVLFTYTIITILTVKRKKPPLGRGINGGWLVTIVATQAVSILGSQLAPRFAGAQEVMLFFELVMWLGGGMLYIWVISLIFYRYTFMPMEPGDLAPPYWINMGAVAISTLAGAMLIGFHDQSPLLMEILPFLKGMTLMYWATATWWIPMLLTLGVWRHLYRRFPLRYDPLYWGAVFPLGMYTAATYRLASTLNEPFLKAIPEYFIYVAVAAWALTFIGLVRRMFSVLRSRGGRPPATPLAGGPA